MHKNNEIMKENYKNSSVSTENSKISKKIIDFLQSPFFYMSSTKVKTNETNNSKEKRSSSLSNKEKEYNSKENSLYHSSNEFIVKNNQLDYNLFLKCFIHELRTPINTITLGIELLEQENPQLKVNETVQDIKLSTEFLENIITNFSTIQDTNIKLNTFAPYSLNLLIKESISILPQNELRKNVMIEYFIENDVFDLNYMDESHLKEVFINLLKNAIKYQTMSRKNTITIIARKKQESSYNNSYRNPSKPSTPRHSFTRSRSGSTNRFIRQHIEISITDTNNHIEPEIKARLFESFNSTSGSGLGLYICKTILEFHNGSIAHEFVFPYGNKFIIELHLDICKNKQLSRDISPIKKVNILYFDDNKLNCKLLKKIFENITICNKVTTIDKNMIEFHDYSEYDIILIDKFMNEISGEELSKSITEKYPKKIIFGLTGNSNIETNTNFSTSLDYLFIKPFTKEKLKQFTLFIETYGSNKPMSKKLQLVNNNLIWV